jgi:hypothetical protein
MMLTLTHVDFGVGRDAGQGANNVASLLGDECLQSAKAY